jgi:DNA mismatch repair protein MutS
MSFNTDKQTLNDLNIPGKPGTNTIFSLYNNTNTRGGADILEKMFLYPLGDVNAINNRSKTLQYFAGLSHTFSFRADQLDSAEIYLAMTDPRTKLVHEGQSLARKFGQMISKDADHELIHNGIHAIISIIHLLNEFVRMHYASASQTPYRAEVEEMRQLLQEDYAISLLKEKPTAKLSQEHLVAYDDMIRFKSRSGVKQLLTGLYHMDVYISLAAIAKQHQFCFPKALPKDENRVLVSGLYHPLVKNAVANSISITPESNVIFLTGANMAGKSTFMKSLGIALYLGHMGFPVAATSMEFSVRDGIYTTINLPDDLSSGNSHFYAEVLRVKKIAKELGGDKNLFIIFDELFRGTNVKDAYEGTIAITEAFAAKRNCMFLVSTHIIEAGEILKQRCSNINYVYLPTTMNGNVPVYTYRLEQGITADRHGMIIINNERILEIIRSRNHKKISA